MILESVPLRMCEVRVPSEHRGMPATAAERPRTTDLLPAAAASAAATAVALFATPLGREVRILLALVLLALVGIVCGRVLERLPVMPAALATGVTSAALVVVADAVQLAGAFRVLSLLIHLPGILLLAPLAVATGRSFVPADPVRAVPAADKRLMSRPAARDAVARAASEGMIRS